MIFDQLTSAIDSEYKFVIKDMVDYRIFLNTLKRWMNSGVWVTSTGDLIEYSKEKIKSIIKSVENPLSKLYSRIVEFFKRSTIISLDRFWNDWDSLKNSCGY